jgi:hypothetical protein
MTTKVSSDGSIWFIICLPFFSILGNLYRSTCINTRPPEPAGNSDSPKRSFFVKLREHRWATQVSKGPAVIVTEDLGHIVLPDNCDFSGANKCTPHPSINPQFKSSFGEVGIKLNAGGEAIRHLEHDASSLKGSIGRPQPLRSSLEERLMNEYHEHVPHLAMNESHSLPQGEAKRDEVSESGTAIIHPVEVWPRDPSRQSTLYATEEISAPLQTSGPSINGESTREFGSQGTGREGVDQMLRKRSEDAGLPSESSSMMYFSPSSRIDSISSAQDRSYADLASAHFGHGPEMPRRRFDFENKRGVREQRRVSRITEADEDEAHSSPKSPNNHSSIPSEGSTESIAVVTKAAIAIRSPPSDIKLVAFTNSMTNEGKLRSQAHTETRLPASPTTQVRLVQFMKHRSYQQESTAQDAGDMPPSKVLHEYPGKREMSHRAVIDGPYGSSTPGDAYPFSLVTGSSKGVPVFDSAPASGLVSEIKRLRAQSERLRDHQARTPQNTIVPSSSDDELLSDPAVILGIKYMQTVDVSTDSESTKPRITSDSELDDTDMNSR